MPMLAFFPVSLSDSKLNDQIDLGSGLAAAYLTTVSCPDVFVPDDLALLFFPEVLRTLLRRYCPVFPFFDVLSWNDGRYACCLPCCSSSHPSVPDEPVFPQYDFSFFQSNKCPPLPCDPLSVHCVPFFFVIFSQPDATSLDPRMLGWLMSNSPHPPPSGLFFLNVPPLYLSF